MSNAEQLESDDGVISRSSGAVRVQSEGPSWIQIEHGFGRSAVLILWLSSFFSAAAIVGLSVAVLAYWGTVAHVNVLQYDLAQVKAQLIEQGLYDPTSH